MGERGTITLQEEANISDLVFNSSFIRLDSALCTMYAVIIYSMTSRIIYHFFYCTDGAGSSVASIFSKCRENFTFNKFNFVCIVVF